MKEKQLKAFIAQAFSLQNTADRAVLDVDALLARVMSDVKKMVELLPEESLLRDKAWKELQPIVKTQMAPYAQALRQAVEQQEITAAPDMKAYAAREAEYAGAKITEGLGRPLPSSVVAQVARAKVGKARFRELFMPKDGPITPWTEQMFRVVDRNVRGGIIQGLTTQQIADLVVHETISRGLKGVSLRGQTSVRQIRAQAMAMTRTVTQDVNHQIKEELWDANADALEGFVYQWSSALDSRTCQTCAPLDGQTWKKKTEVPASVPAHVNCRCQLLLIDPEDEFWEKDKKVGQQISETPYATGYKTKVKVKGEKFYRKAKEFSGNDYGDYLASSNLTTQTEFFGGGPIGQRRANYFRSQIGKVNKDPQDILSSMLTGPSNAKKFIPLPELAKRNALEAQQKATAAKAKVKPKPKPLAPKPQPKPKAEIFTPLEKLTNERMVSELEKRWDIPVPKGLRDERQLLADQLADMRGVTRLGSSRLGEIDDLIKKNKSLVTVSKPREVSGNTRLSREFNEAETVLGKGSFGEARLTSKGDVIKSGAIGQDEVKAMQRLERSGISPVLKDAEAHTDLALGGGREADGASAFIGKYDGMLKMSRAKGVSMETVERTNEVSELFLRSSKKMHLQGVAHNDRHMGNIFVDDKKVSFLDFGLAQTDSRAALVEALGNDDPVFDRQGGDLFLTNNLGKNSVWQVFRRNKASVISKLKASSKGSKLLKKEIRTSGETLSELISEKEAQALLVELYEGI